MTSCGNANRGAGRAKCKDVLHFFTQPRGQAGPDVCLRRPIMPLVIPDSVYDIVLKMRVTGFVPPAVQKALAVAGVAVACGALYWALS